MLVLALDTTTRAGSCALMHDGVAVAQAASDAAASTAARLPRDLMALLGGVGVPLRDVDAFAVATGPGSFTGTRVGVATMQGLAFAADKPLVGVSGLDALARAAEAEAATGGVARIAAWVNAWRGDVYAAVYQDGREAQAPVLARPESLLAALEGRQTLFVGDGVITHLASIQATLGPLAVLAAQPTPLLAGTIAALASDMLRAGHRPQADAIRPVYVPRFASEPGRDGH